MVRNLKMLGLSVVAVCAISAMMASTASAVTPFWINSDGDWTVLSGVQGATPDSFGFHGGAFTCTAVAYSGSSNATTTTTMKLAPTYGGCVPKGIGNVTVDMNGCEYEFHADTNTGSAFDVETTIVCPGTNEITITAIVAGVTKCTIHIEQQNLGTGLAFTNEGTPTTDLKADIAFANIKYTQTAGTGGGSCLNTTTTTNGTWAGSATIQGKNTSGTATSISVT